MKIFAVSDIHSFFTPMKKELDKKGFEANNPDHLLVVCGDLFDRGTETIQLIEYINSLNNVVLVRGNHEDLMEKMWERGYPKSYDHTNGTVRTYNDIIYNHPNYPSVPMDGVAVVKETLQPIFNRMVNYFETKNYVFVHGWIPMKYDASNPYAEYNDPTLFDEDWRNGDWDSARWFNGARLARNGIIVPDKTVVCGHWHCSWGWHVDSIQTDNWISQFYSDAIWEPYYGNKCIAIDRCTAHTGEVNVLVLEDDLLEED